MSRRSAPRSPAAGPVFPAGGRGAGAGAGRGFRSQPQGPKGDFGQNTDRKHLCYVLTASAISRGGTTDPAEAPGPAARQQLPPAHAAPRRHGPNAQRPPPALPSFPPRGRTRKLTSPEGSFVFLIKFPSTTLCFYSFSPAFVKSNRPFKII